MKTILFVCIENANRSQMAEAFAKIYAKELIESYSAGSFASGKVNEMAIEVMAEIGYDLKKHASKSVKMVENIKFDYVVSMGCGDSCPQIQTKNRIEWDIDDPKGKGIAAYRNTRDIIAKKVKELIVELTKTEVVS